MVGGPGGGGGGCKPSTRPCACARLNMTFVGVHVTACQLENASVRAPVVTQSNSAHARVPVAVSGGRHPGSTDGGGSSARVDRAWAGAAVRLGRCVQGDAGGSGWRGRRQLAGLWACSSAVWGAALVGGSYAWSLDARLAGRRGRIQLPWSSLAPSTAPPPPRPGPPRGGGRDGGGGGGGGGGGPPPPHPPGRPLLLAVTRGVGGAWGLGAAQPTQLWAGDQ